MNKQFHLFIPMLVASCQPLGDEELAGQDQQQFA
jgi:hypothetical protein